MLGAKWLDYNIFWQLIKFKWTCADVISCSLWLWDRLHHCNVNKLTLHESMTTHSDFHILWWANIVCTYKAWHSKNAHFWILVSSYLSSGALDLQNHCVYPNIMGALWWADARILKIRCYWAEIWGHQNSKVSIFTASRFRQECSVDIVAPLTAKNE